MIAVKALDDVAVEAGRVIKRGDVFEVSEQDLQKEAQRKFPRFLALADLPIGTESGPDLWEQTTDALLEDLSEQASQRDRSLGLRTVRAARETLGVSEEQQTINHLLGMGL